MKTFNKSDLEKAFEAGVRHEGLDGAKFESWYKRYISPKPAIVNEKCRCGAKGRNPHTCPYAEDINSDFEKKCNCCNACTHECAMDI